VDTGSREENASRKMSSRHMICQKSERFGQRSCTQQQTGGGADALPLSCFSLI
jgi:hypothetical protein